MQKITLHLDKAEWEALIDLSMKEHRPAQYQAEFILRQELERRGLLENSNSTQGTQYVSAIPIQEPTT